MSESLQHGNHSGHMHHGGGDGSAFSGGLFGHNGNGHHNFLAHLLGLDHDHNAHGHQPGGVHHNHNGGLDKTPQGSISWSSAMQGLKLSDALQGINVTPNMLFLLLFGGFFVWLYVVYFVRHHDPLAHQVLGTGAAYSATAPADISIVSGMRNALPIRTGPTTGAVYVPSNAPPVPQAAAYAGALSAPPPAVPAPAYGSAPTGVFSQAPAGNMGAYTDAPPPAVPAAYATPMTGGAQSYAPTMGSYHLPVQTADGMRLKTVVNR